MTEKERRELEYKKEVLRLALEKQKAVDDFEDMPAYEMPTEYKGTVEQREADLVSSRYSDRDRRRGKKAEEDRQGGGGQLAWVEQEHWEREQMAKTGVRKTGAQDKAVEGDQYDMLFDDQIDFVMDALAAGADFEEAEDPVEAQRRARIQAIQDERERIQAQRKDLPMYAYREELLAAIAAHQVKSCA